MMQYEQAGDMLCSNKRNPSLSCHIWDLTNRFETHRYTKPQMIHVWRMVTENCIWRKILKCCGWRLILKHCAWRLISKRCVWCQPDARQTPARCQPDASQKQLLKSGFRRHQAPSGQTPARRSVLKSGVRRKTSKSSDVISCDHASDVQCESSYACSIVSVVALFKTLRLIVQRSRGAEMTIYCAHTAQTVD